jgi:type IV pilus assembly protein PilC
VVPAFADFYGGFDRPLPMLTTMIVGFSDFIINNLVVIVLALAASVAAFVTWAKSPGQRARLHRLLFRLPWVGDTFRKFSVAQLARTLATLLGGGIPLVNALEISVKAISNKHLARELEIVRQQVQEGQSFSESLRARGIFPDVAVKMVEVGESTGALQEMLNSLADFFDEEIDTAVSRFITLVEPVLLIIMGIIIAIVVLALYMPVFELSSVVG